MAEVQSRPAASRGRGSGRGGRGGLSSRGGRAGARSHPNGDKYQDDAFDDDQELAPLKKQYSSQISQLKDVFPAWSDNDLALALQESSGDVEVTVDGIMNGSISQWGEVSNHKKSHARSKPKESPATESSSNARAPRGGRSASDPARGRGRAAERGGRGGRGRAPSQAATNGGRPKENAALSVPTETAWAAASTTSADDALGPSAQDNASASSPAKDKEAIAATTTATPAVPKSTTGGAKTWAAMLRQSTAPKPAPKPVETPAPKPTEPEPLTPPPAEEPEESEPAPAEPEPPAVEEEPEPVPEEVPSVTEVPTIAEPDVALPPSRDQLTETNLEQIADTSNPPATGTAASTAADSWDPRQAPVSATATPVSASQQQHATRPAGSGFVASAQKATERHPRVIGHHQRRVLEQEEAVRMPGNREVDRAAIKFGGFTLEDEDIDEEREEPETRAQPPADSPIAPRASLPPVQAQAAPAPESFPAAKATDALPPTGPATAAAVAAVPSGPPVSAPTQPAAAAAASASAPQQPTQPNQQFGRFAQTGTQDQASFAQKPFDSFVQQPPTAPAAQAQAPLESGLQGQVSQSSIQQPSSAAAGAFASGPNDYAAFYTADQSSRTPYNNSFYHQQQFGQQQGVQGQTQGQQDVPAQQRPFMGYNASQNENLSQYPQSNAQHSQSRFGAGAGAGSDVQNSGHNTPNPTAQNQPSAPGNQGQSHVQQQPHNSQYAYSQHPYYNSPYYSQYMSYGGQYGQGAYGAGPYGKGGLYGQPHQYGMSPQGPFDHSSSASGGFGQGSLHRGDSGIGSGLADYRSSSATQSGNQPGIGGNSGFGGMHDSFGRGGSGYPSQAGQGFNAPSSQPGNAGAGSDDLKPFGDAKTTGGPSPSLSSAARPGSAANNPASQGGLPPTQTNQQAGMGGMGGYGGYPSHLQGHGLHGAQAGNSGYGMGGGTNQHNSNFGPYNQYGGGSYYGNQRGGWGGNYH